MEQQEIDDIPRRLIFEGKEISQADFESVLEYTAKMHIESMTSFGGRKMKNKKTLENCETAKQEDNKRETIIRTRNSFAKPCVPKSVNFPEEQERINKS